MVLSDGDRILPAFASVHACEPAGYWLPSVPTPLRFALQRASWPTPQDGPGDDQAGAEHQADDAGSPDCVDVRTLALREHLHQDRVARRVVAGLPRHREAAEDR